MQTSLFIAKLIGPLLALMGFVVLAQPERVRRIADEFLESHALIFLSGIITLPVGLAIVNTHNVWEADWPVLITIFGWLAVLAGVARLAFPEIMKAMGKTMIENAAFFAIPGILMLALGAYLSYQGYVS